MESKVRLGRVAPFLTATLIFILTALMGVWAAPDRSAALVRFTLFIVGLLFMVSATYLVKLDAETALGILGLFCSILALIGAVYFLLTANWGEAGLQRLRLVQQIGFWMHDHSLELSNLGSLHKNIAGGLLIILLPFGFSGAIWAWTRRYGWVVAVAVAASVIGAFGLFMTVSRGAWVGFGLAIGYTLYFMWRSGPGTRFGLRWLVDLLVSVCTVAFLVSVFLSVKVPQFEPIPNGIFGDSAITRTELWRDSLALIQDYPFTGSGLGGTAMVYSSYVFLLHVPFLSHAHNLFLQIAIEQGIPGLIAFVAMVMCAFLGLIHVYRHGNSLIRVFCAATFAALVAMLGHGLVEAEPYANPSLPIIFWPLGFAFALLLGKTSQQLISMSDTAIRRANRLALAGSLAPVLFIMGLFFLPGARAALAANMGAVTQTRAELAIYRWPDWPIQDELRRNGAVDLSKAIGYYNNALALSPGNVTAHRRLGQIAISVGDYVSAQRHLEIAYEMAPDQRATRQLLGELYAIRGELEKAAQLWKTVDITHGQLDARYWWYAHIGEEKQAERLKRSPSQLNTTN